MLLFSFIFLYDHFFQKAKIFTNLTCAWCILAEIDLIDSTVQIYLVNTPIWFKTFCTYHAFCILMPLLLKIIMCNVLAVIKTFEAAYCHKMVTENCSNYLSETLTKSEWRLSKRWLKITIVKLVFFMHFFAQFIHFSLWFLLKQSKFDCFHVLS